MTTPTTRTLGRDDWMTPPEVFDPVHRLVQFDLDACATSASVSRLPQFITPDEDALKVDWSERGSRVWCNPPYGRGIKHWFEKARYAAPDLQSLVMLTYANTDTKYWHEHVVGTRHVWLVVFLTPRVKFVLPGDDDQRAGAPKGSALIFYSPALRPGHIRHRYWNYNTHELQDALGMQESQWVSA